MQNKKAVIALLIVTAAVWGMIAYRIISTLAGSATPQIADDYAPTTVSAVHALDTFSLMGDYRDPFLGYIESPKPVVSSTVPASVRPVSPPPTPKATVPFPAVSYLGRVKNHDSQKKVAIMMIKNGMRNMSEGDSYNEVTLLKIMDDSVKVCFDKEKRSIPKSGHRQDKREIPKGK